MQFSEDIAVQYGVFEAIFINNLAFWLKTNRANNTNQFDGKTWSYNTFAGFGRYFAFWNARQIKHIVHKLTKANVIVTRKPPPSENNIGLFYSFVDEKMFMTKSELQTIEQQNLSHPQTNMSDPQTNMSDPTYNINIVNNINTLSSSTKSNVDGASALKCFQENFEDYNKKTEQLKKEPARIQAIFLLAMLNVKAGRHFRYCPEHIKMIEARLHSGVSLVDAKRIINHKVKEWGHRPEMAVYLRPATLFARTNFENYLGEFDNSTTQNQKGENHELYL
jgi:uncharacterized phage protein (TIGR02220 family)